MTCPVGGSLTVDWGDGSLSAVTCNGLLQTLVHNYTVTGQYIIRVLGSTRLITTFRCYNQAWISGDIAGVVRGLRDVVNLYLYSTGVTGDISAVSPLTSLTTLYLYSTGVTGDISAVSPLTSLTALRLYSTGMGSYTTGPLPAWPGIDMRFDDLGLSTADLDQFLIDVADGIGVGADFDCLTGNGPRSGASDAAVAAIVAAGGSVT